MCWASGPCTTLRPLGGIACGIFGLKTFGGMGGISFLSQLVGSLGGALFGFLAGFVVYWLVDQLLGFRMAPEDERRGADLTVHKISANRKKTSAWGGCDALR